MQQKNQHIYELIEVCRLCSSRDLQEILDLGDQPPANSLGKDAHEIAPCAPLKLVHCGNCCGVQLSATVNPSYLFSQYVWVTGTSKTAQSYSDVYCGEVLSRASIGNPFVVEVASNDGTFLKKFKDKECEILGIDPAKNIADNACASGIPTINEFFDVEIAQKILLDYGRPSIVMARNVIPHVKEIHSIVEGMSCLVDDRGIVVVEFHYAKIIAEELHYDSIYHEHLFYFSLKSLAGLFAKYGLYPFDLITSPISGGSLVLFFSKQKKEPSAALNRLVISEESSGLNRLSTWQKFGEKSAQHANSLKSIVKKYTESGRMLAYGASARSSTLMNFSKISHNEIECVIDRNPIKQGLFTPGTNIPIISYEEGLTRIADKNLLLLAWNFGDEIVNDLRVSGFGGDIIIPLPNAVHIK